LTAVSGNPWNASGRRRRIGSKRIDRPERPGQPPTRIITLNEAKETRIPVLEAWKKEGIILIIPLEANTPALWPEIAAGLPRWLDGQRIMVFDMGRVFADRAWKVPQITSRHLDRAVIFQLSAWRPHELAFVLDRLPAGPLEKWPAVQPTYREVFTLLHRYSRYIYQTSLLVTDACNLHCRMCMFHSRDSQHYEFAAKRRRDRPRREITPKSVYRFISQLPAASNLLFSSSGELLMSRAAQDYVEGAGRRGLNLQVQTNGLLLTEEISERFIDAGVGLFIISADAHHGQAYERRGQGENYDRLLKNIEALRRLRQKKDADFEIVINTIMFPEYEKQRDDIIDFWTGRADKISFMAERITYLGKARSYLIPPPNLPYCFAQMEGPFLLSNGLTAPCCSIAIGEWFEPMPWLKSIDEADLFEIVQWYRRLMLDDSSPLSRYCRRCDWRSNSYWQNGISPYSELVPLPVRPDEEKKQIKALSRRLGDWFRKKRG
jgi:pyruvate-formate lyase-activating enzyme